MTSRPGPRPHPPRLQRIAWTLAAFYAAFHFVMTHIPPGTVPTPRVRDKTLHFLSYGLIGGLLYAALWLGGATIARAAILVLTITAIFGALDELLQAPVGRTPEFADWVVDLAAALVAVTCFSLLRAIMRKSDKTPVTIAPGD